MTAVLRPPVPRREPIWHAARPGPWPTWDWRCLTCDQPCVLHAGLLRRLWHRLRTRPTRRGGTA